METTESNSDGDNKSTHKGVTAPMSLKKPTDDDVVDNGKMLEAIKDLDVFETEGGNKNRALALLTLQHEAQEWIKLHLEAQSVPLHLLEKAGGKIYTFGSYRLGVNTKGADVDALLVAPCFISREDFFNGFYIHLLNHPDAEEIQCVPDAYVPIMKLKFLSIEIDLLFAAMNQQMIPDDFDVISCMEAVAFVPMDDQTMRSLNGVRVTEAILDLVPNVRVFKLSLRAIRTWAKRKLLYSNVLGYLGGVSWAILVARICQLFPNAVASVIVQKFFFVLNQWDWPRPVLIRHTKGTDFMESASVMPIVTPAEPPQNSTYNVNVSSLKVLKQAFESGVETIKDIIYKRAQWSDLFTPADFFAKYKHYLHVCVQADEKDDFLECSGLVESRLRHLIISLDKNNYIDIAHINTRTFGRADESKEFVKKWFIGLLFRKPRDVTQADGTIVKEVMNVDLTNEISYFIRQTQNIFMERGKKAGYIERPVPMDFRIKYAKKSDLGKFMSREDCPEDVRPAIRPRHRNSNSESSRTSSRRNSAENGSLTGKRKRDSEDTSEAGVKRHISESSSGSPEPSTSTAASSTSQSHAAAEDTSDKPV